jgi:uncharacterized RDD family membrane protein YckC
MLIWGAVVVGLYNFVDKLTDSRSRQSTINYKFEHSPTPGNTGRNVVNCLSCGAPVVEGQHICSRCMVGAQNTTADTETPYAGFWRRGLAWLVDFALAWIAPTIALRKVGAWAGTSFVSAVLTMTAVFLIPWLYNALCESSKARATLGKLACGIKVADLAGNRISFLRATGRFFAHILSVPLAIGYAMVLFTDRCQALHDMLAGTLVVGRGFAQQSIEQAGPAPRVSPLEAALALLCCLGASPFGIGTLVTLLKLSR